MSERVGIPSELNKHAEHTSASTVCQSRGHIPHVKSIIGNRLGVIATALSPLGVCCARGSKRRSPALMAVRICDEVEGA